MSEIGLDIPTQGIPAWDVEYADMCSPTADNAIPLVVLPKFVGDASEKIVRLTDIHRIPVAVESALTKDVNAWPRVIGSPNGMKVKVVAFAARSKPCD